MMKYSINHPWKFRQWPLAFSIGLIQFCMELLAEIVSACIILSVATYIDAVKDFIVLMVVNEFDNFLFMN